MAVEWASSIKQRIQVLIGHEALLWHVIKLQVGPIKSSETFSKIKHSYPFMIPLNNVQEGN